MTFDQLTTVFIAWGYAVRSDQYDDFMTYTSNMLKKKRVMLIRSENGLEAIIFFFLTNDYSKLYKKSRWAIPDDEPQGSQVYIDKMICKKWTHLIRRQVQDFIESNFPNVQEGFYHRAPYDRCVRIMRRSVHV